MIDQDHGNQTDDPGKGAAVAGAAAQAAGRLLEDSDPWIKQTAKTGGKEWIKHYDQNKDGVVNQNEYDKVELAKLSKRREDFAGDNARSLMAIDQNSDNKITMAELSKRMDMNSANQIMKAGDTNNDGFIDFNEAKDSSRITFDRSQKDSLRAQFSQFDGNRNGTTTLEEATARIERMLRSVSRPPEHPPVPVPGQTPRDSNSPTTVTSGQVIQATGGSNNKGRPRS